MIDKTALHKAIDFDVCFQPIDVADILATTISTALFYLAKRTLLLSQTKPNQTNKSILRA